MCKININLDKHMILKYLSDNEFKLDTYLQRVYAKKIQIYIEY